MFIDYKYLITWTINFCKVKFIGDATLLDITSIFSLTDRRKCDKLDLRNEAEWETKTVTSAIKNYFRYYN